VVNLPEQPASFGAPRLPESAWWWRFETVAGETVEVDEEYVAQRFPSQAEAESWVGESYAKLVSLGVDAVSLFEEERLVYGPMSLHPEAG
jgi:hypothetical protein